MYSLFFFKGQLSREAQKTQNKNYRELHTRKLSRVKINEDLINMLLVLSDPIISSMRNIQPKKLQTFLDDAKLLIIMPEDQTSGSSDSESDDSGTRPWREKYFGEEGFKAET